MRNTTQREVGRRERCGGDAKPSRPPLGWGAPPPKEQVASVLRASFVLSGTNIFTPPLSRVWTGDSSFTLWPLQPVRNGANRDSGRLESPRYPHGRMSLARNTPAITKESKSASAAKRDISRSS